MCLKHVHAWCPIASVLIFTGCLHVASQGGSITLVLVKLVRHCIPGTLDMCMVQFTRDDVCTGARYQCQASSRTLETDARLALRQWWDTVSAEARTTPGAVPAANTRAFRVANKFLVESRIDEFVHTANTKTGIAPSTSVVIAEIQRWHASLPPHALPLLTTGMRRKAQCQWVRGWRRRWGVSLSCIGAREDEPIEVTRRKVWAGQNRKYLCVL